MLSDEKQPCHWLLVSTNQMHQSDGFIFYLEWLCITVIGMKILWIHCTLYHFRLVVFLWFLSNLLIHSSLVHLIQNAWKKINWAIMQIILKVWVRSVGLSSFNDWRLSLKFNRSIGLWLVRKPKLKINAFSNVFHWWSMQRVDVSLVTWQTIMPVIHHAVYMIMLTVSLLWWKILIIPLVVVFPRALKKYPKDN